MRDFLMVATILLAAGCEPDGTGGGNWQDRGKEAGKEHGFSEVELPNGYSIVTVDGVQYLCRHHAMVRHEPGEKQ